MKKILLSAVALLVVLSCQKEETEVTTTNSAPSARRSCASQDVLDRQLGEDPTLALRLNKIESFTETAIRQKRLVNGKIVIPVVVNVLQRTSETKLSDAQIQSQIDVLNKDFNGTNSEFASGIPAEFNGLKANVGISFELVNIVRKSTTKTSWGTRDAMKKSAQGGINPTSPTNTLNLWACTIGGGILGYAQFPGGTLATDGVVIDTKYFGLSSTASYPYNLGRTATHEVGHWMNLRHIWGDASCGNDQVSDTPVHKTANYGVPTYPYASTCLPAHNEMTMNYMDYTDDRGMFMFTLGQKSRMSAIFVSGGARSGFGL